MIDEKKLRFKLKKKKNKIQIEKERVGNYYD